MEGSHKIGVAEIVYYVHMTDRDGLVLRRADHLYPFPEFKPSDKDPVLAKHIHSLSFAFFDDEGNAHESWDSDSEEFGYATPRAIAINIGLPGKSEPKLFGTKISLPIYREAKK
jgi:general secretion pathway protein J